MLPFCAATAASLTAELPISSRAKLPLVMAPRGKIALLRTLFETPHHGRAPRFHALEILEDRDVEGVLARVQRRVLRHLEKLGLLSSHEDRAAEDPAFEEEPFLAACYAGSIVGRQAFGPEAGLSVPRLDDPNSVRRSPTPTPLCARAAEQLSLTPQGKLLFRLSRPFADGIQALRFEPPAFHERLIALVPRP